MHFRFRGNSVQVVRSIREPESGRAKSVPIGSINRSTLRISEGLRAQCSAAELKEIEAWVIRYEATSRLKCEFAAASIAAQIATAADWLQGSMVQLDSATRDDIVHAWNRLRKEMVRKA